MLKKLTFMLFFASPLLLGGLIVSLEDHGSSAKSAISDKNNHSNANSIAEQAMQLPIELLSIAS